MVCAPAHAGRMADIKPARAISGRTMRPAAWHWSSAGLGRGRDCRYRPPPAQIRASAPNAHGSYLGCLDAKRTSGYGLGPLSPARKAPRFHACLASTTPQCLIRACDVSRVTVLSSGSPDTVGASDFGYFGAHQLQGYPAYMCRCPALQVRGCPPALTWLGVRMVSLFLSRMTFSFTTQPAIPSIYFTAWSYRPIGWGDARTARSNAQPRM